MERYILDRILKEKLYEGDPYVDMSGWDHLKESISAVDNARQKKKSFVLKPFLRYAAALLLIIGLGTGGYFLFGPKQTDIKVAETTSRTINEPAPNNTTTGNAGNGLAGNEPNVQNQPANNLSAQTILIDSTSNTTPLPTSSSNVNLTVVNDQQREFNNIVGNVNSNEYLFVESPAIRSLKSLPPDLILAPKNTYDLAEYLQESRDVYDETDKSQNRWTASLTANTLSMNSDVDNMSGVMGTPSSVIAQLISNLSMNGYYGKSTKDNLLLINYLDGTYEFPASTFVHKSPVSLGAAINKKIGNRLGVGTGLFYTYMESHAGSRTADNAFYEQKLHYLGIPISLSCSLMNEHSAWSLDAKTGLVAEKALAAKGITTIYSSTGTSVTSIFKDTPSEPMLSMNIGVGIGYKLFGDVSLYAEPLLWYYFYTKGQPISYKTDRPVNFSVRAGIKIDF
jgi:hypothetical protein